MKTIDFFRKHRVFTSQEYNDFLKKTGRTGARTQEALLAYHIKVGHLIHLKRGLYAVVTPGAAPASFIADPYLIASKLCEDAVIGYHTDLAFYELNEGQACEFDTLINCSSIIL